MFAHEALATVRTSIHIDAEPGLSLGDKRALE
jgi:hypothetical protein